MGTTQLVRAVNLQQCITAIPFEASTSHEIALDEVVTLSFNASAPEECLNYIRRRVGTVFEQNTELIAAGTLYVCSTASLEIIHKSARGRDSRRAELARAFAETSTPSRQGKTKRYSDANRCFAFAKHPEVKKWATEAMQQASIDAAVGYMKSKFLEQAKTMTELEQVFGTPVRISTRPQQRDRVVETRSFLCRLEELIRGAQETCSLSLACSWAS